ncbi:MAG TPA: carboxypeptidase regulatory-like domain-containing protein [Vicinamibacterales bacterium]|nr:carboxypeptidase regulatory-like domain-containing protein [Vicinamibacterales bacterium]
MIKLVVRGKSSLCMLLVLFVLVPRLALAQTANTGTIAGEAKDTSGALLPGVTVEAASPALIEKVRTAVTDDQGKYRITDLRPGTYSITFTLPGFATFTREGVVLDAGFTANIVAELKVGALQESVTVSGATPIVDVQNSRSQNVLNREVLDTLPTSKSMAALAAVTVGALTTGQSLGGGDVGGSKGDTVFGFSQIHGSLQGMRTLDGMRLSSAYNVAASTRSQVNQVMVQEIVLDTGFASVETESSGMNMNVVPKDGGNRFSATFMGEGTNSSLQTGSNISDDLKARGLTVGSPIQKIWDVGGGGGGPIKKDKVWFYAGGREWGSIQNIAGVFFNKPQNQAALDPSVIAAGGFLPFSPDSSRPAFYDRYTRDAAVRVTWQVDPKNKIAFYGDVQNYCWCNAYFTTNQEASWDFHVYPNNNWVVSWTNTATNKLLITGGFSYRQDRQFNGIPAIPGSPANNAIPVLDVGTGVAYGSRYVSTGLVGDTELGDMGNQWAYQTRFSMSYVTGSHNLKIGENSMSGFNGIASVSPIYPYQYILNNGVPFQIKEGAYPYSQSQNLKLLLGLYASDQWTIKNLTLNLGVRYDGLNGYVPAAHYPGSAPVHWPGGAYGAILGPADFPEVDNVPNWHDLSPRLGVAWDVRGNGKTAVKASYGRYVNFETTQLTKQNNPIAGLVANASRAWNDTNHNYVPDCDLLNPAANGECGPILNNAFGTAVVNTHYAPDVTSGWFHRPYNNQVTAVLQQEIRPGLGLTVGYYRTSYGNKTITNNLAVSSADYTQFCVTAPVDPRLPGGGGNQICGNYDLNPNKVGQVNNLVVRDTALTEVYQGVDVIGNWHFGTGGLLQGGVSFGRTDYNNCSTPLPGEGGSTLATPGGAVATSVTPVLGSQFSTAFCQYSWGWQGQTQVKGQFAYPIWYDFRLALTFQNNPGLAQAATFGFTNAQVAPSLGRNLSTGSVAVLNIMAPNSLYEPRYSQFDVRVSRRFKFGQLTLEPRADVYNLFNSVTALGSIGGYGSAWLRPTDVLGARLAKFGVQVDW